MNFLEELEWRGMLHQKTDGVAKYLSQGDVPGYIGFDPTGPAPTIGNYVQIMLLTLYQKHGHKPIALMGGATGRIGDPSGKDKERLLKSYEELDHNLLSFSKYFGKFLDCSFGKTGAIVVNNHDFYREMNVLDYLRDVGKNLTVNYMLSKESVQRRLEGGLSYTEFSYQLLQAYDFLCLYRNYNCKFQMGGSDQWGNITSGTEFIRRNIPESDSHALTTPLLTKSDGGKFGKSESGAIWLDPELTTPYQFYQFWINADDKDVPKYVKYFSLKSIKEMEEMLLDLEANPRKIKELLAEELTTRIHSLEDFHSVQNVSNLLFNPKLEKSDLAKLSISEWKMLAGEIPTSQVKKEIISNQVSLAELMTTHSNILSSKGDFKRAMQGNALSLNKEKITSEIDVNSSNLFDGGYILLENGKKNKYLIQVI
jgi:tyrosyl-tRNA synthetase